MSYYYKDPIIKFSKVNYNGKQYLYIFKEDNNVESSDDKISWIYIDLDGFWMKKYSTNLVLGNYLGEMYILDGQFESTVNNYTNEIKNTIGFP